MNTTMVPEKRGKSRRRRSLARDPWIGASQDLIERFLDVLRTEYGLSEGTCSEYQTELCRLDTWSQQCARCTIVSAREQDLCRYLAREASISVHTMTRALRAMRRFYAFVQAMHFRKDDPTPRPVELSWDAGAPPLEPLDLHEPGWSTNAAWELRDRIVASLARTAGLRLTDLTELRLGDLCLEKGYMVLGPLRRPRIVLLSARTSALLRWFLEHSRPELLLGRDSMDVFPAQGACRADPASTLRESSKQRRRRQDP